MATNRRQGWSWSNHDHRHVDPQHIKLITGTSKNFTDRRNAVSKIAVSRQFAPPVSAEIGTFQSALT